MTTTTRTCDKCQAVIPNNLYNFNQTVTVHVGHYDRQGTKLEFCSDCWDTTYNKHMVKKSDDIPSSIPERIMSLLTELIELIPSQNEKQ